MERAMWLASIFGPFLAIIGLWMLIYADNLVKVISSIKNTAGAFYIGGIINLLLGLTIVTQNNIWVWSGALLVTILGWAWIVRGVLVLFIPQAIIKMTMSHKGFIKGMGVIPLVWGLALCWYAFF
jgi:hypothetical protein